MKAVEPVEATEPSPVPRSDCLLRSTGCCISTRQWVSSLFVLAAPLRHFKRIELQAFSSSCQCEWVWYSVPCQPPLFVFLFFSSSFHFLSCPRPFISIFLSLDIMSAPSPVSLRLFPFSLIQISVASLHCHIMSCPVSSIKLQWTLPAFNLRWWVETSRLHMNIHGCVCKRDAYRGW